MGKWGVEYEYENLCAQVDMYGEKKKMAQFLIQQIKLLYRDTYEHHYNDDIRGWVHFFEEQIEHFTDMERNLGADAGEALKTIKEIYG
jgi:hypothetical protein